MGVDNPVCIIDAFTERLDLMSLEKGIGEPSLAFEQVVRALTRNEKAAEKRILLFSAALWLKTPTSIFLQKIFFRKYHHRRLSAFG